MITPFSIVLSDRQRGWKRGASRIWGLKGTFYAWAKGGGVCDKQLIKFQNLCFSLILNNVILKQTVFLDFHVVFNICICLANLSAYLYYVSCHMICMIIDPPPFHKQHTHTIIVLNEIESHLNLSIYLSIYPSIYLSIYLSILSIYLSTSIFTSIFITNNIF